jgi:molybdenum cofactor cytidylyltransferase
MIAIVILAAGTSTRLGRPKQLLDLGGEPLLRHTVRNALASQAGEVVLVLGNRADDIAEAVGELGQRRVTNPDFAAGQSTSLRVGIEAVSAEADAVIVMLGDQPMVTPTMLDQIIEHFELTGAPIVQPVYGETPGNPVLLARSLFPELLAIEGDQGARGVIKSHA